jgi:hypothetical protein
VGVDGINHLNTTPSPQNKEGGKDTSFLYPPQEGRKGRKGKK